MYILWHLDGRENLHKAKPRKFYRMPGGPYPTRISAANAASEFQRKGKLVSYAITPVGKTPLDPIGD